MAVTIPLYGIESAEAFGASTISAPFPLTGIASAEAFGTGHLGDGKLRGIASSEWVGFGTLTASDPSLVSYPSGYRLQSLSAALLSVGVRTVATSGQGTGASGGSSGRGTVTVPAVSIVPTGALNGVNKTFTIPAGYTIILLFLDTQQVEPTSDYTVNYTTATITVAAGRAAPTFAIRALCSYTAP